MFKTLIGILILICPFILVRRFKKAHVGFAYGLTLSISLHLAIALCTQAARIFYYPVIISIWCIVAVAFFIGRSSIKYPLLSQDIRADASGDFWNMKKNLRRIDWMFVFVLVVSFACLFQVHYCYNGLYSVLTTTEYQQASNMVYPYPYYADEWVAVVFLKNIFYFHSLPFQAGFIPIVNFVFCFHALLAEIVLILQIDPVTDYALLVLGYGILLCACVYLFFRVAGVSKFAASMATLSLLYIVNGANLPGLWTLIPLTFSLIVVTLLLLFFELRQHKISMLLSFLALIFYPPILPFIIALCVGYALSHPRLKMKILSYSSVAILSAIFCIALGSLYVGTGGFQSLELIAKRIVYETLVSNGIPYYPLWLIVPTPALFFAAFGLPVILKKRPWLVLALILGLLFWALYAFVLFRIIIDYQRVVVLTSFLLVLCSGFGFDYVLRKCLSSKKKSIVMLTKIIQISALFYSALIIPQYTRNNDWLKLTIRDVATQTEYKARALANQYVHPDDRRVFEPIKFQTFLSVPWKGLVLSVVTDNIPVCTKPATFTFGKDIYSDFMRGDDRIKKEIARKYKLDYVYASPFVCHGFEFVDKSEEGFCLYKVKK